MENMTDEERIRLVAVTRAYTMNKLTTMELTTEELMTFLEKVDLDGERWLVGRVRDAVQDALAYLEDPVAYVEDNMPEPEGEE